MRRWRLRTDKAPSLAHCWAYQDRALSDGTFPPGYPICGVLSVPQQNWTDWQPGASWCIGFCQRCEKKQHRPERGASGTTR